MQFPQRDLTSQYISTSYQDVVQRYDSGSVQYFLDALGNVIIGVNSSSLGSTIITNDITSSMVVLSSSFAESSSFSNISNFASVADVSLIADTASVAALADFATSASWSANALTASSINFSIVSSSYATNATNSSTASYALTSSYFNAANVNASGLILGCSTKTNNYALTSTDYTIIMNGSTNLSASLPDATTSTGRLYNIKNITTNPVTVTGSQDIDDNSSGVVLTQFITLTVQSSGVQWYII